MRPPLAPGRRHAVGTAAVLVASLAGHAVQCASGAGGEFEVVLRDEGPLGLRLVPLGDADEGMRVTDVDDGGVVAPLGIVHPGDVLMRVNGNKVPSSDFAAGIQMLQRARWPRTLRFRATDGRAVDSVSEPSPGAAGSKQPADQQNSKGKGREEAQGDGNWVDVEVLSPAVVATTIRARAAQFGVKGRCVVYSLVRAKLACSKQQVAQEIKAAPLEASDAGSEARREPIMVLADRGQCTFVDKAKNSLNAGAAAVMLIDTGAGGSGAGSKLPDMPAGPYNVQDLADARFETMIVARRDGAVLKTLLDAGAVVRARVGPGGAPCEEEGSGAGGEEEEVVEIEADGSVGRTGRASASTRAAAGTQKPAAGGAGSPPSHDVSFTLWTVEHELVLTVRRALFGAEAFEERAMPVVLGGVGCRGFDASPRDAVLLLDRGECPFEDKVRLAQQRGAAAVVFINTDNSVTRVGAADPEGVTVGIGMVGKAKGEEVKEAVRKAGNGVAIGRFLGPVGSRGA